MSGFRKDVLKVSGEVSWLFLSQFSFFLFPADQKDPSSADGILDKGFELK